MGYHITVSFFALNIISVGNWWRFSVLGPMSCPVLHQHSINQTYIKALLKFFEQL